MSTPVSPIQAMFEAWQAGSDYRRCRVPNRMQSDWLRELCRMGFTPEDVRAVLARRKARGLSLHFTNALEPVKFQCEAEDERRRKQARIVRVATKPAPPRPDAARAEAIRAQAQSGLADLRKQLRGGGAGEPPVAKS